MLRDSPAFQGFAVPDVEAAKAFYADVLGLDVEEENGMLRLHLAGGRETIVYPKPDHTPATYTILNFPVSDIEAAVDGLTERGVRFERYEGPRRRPTLRGCSAAADRSSPGSPTPPATC